MSLQAGFARTEITPPLGTKKIGWMADLSAEKILDPLHARVAIFENGPEQLAFIALDILSIRWSDTDDLRKRIEAKFGFPGARIMVSATHNHAGPATARVAPVARDDGYLSFLKERCLEAFGEAWRGREPAEIGLGSVREFDVAFNRRTVTRDGTVRTQLPFHKPEALYTEGPVDPEVAVWQVRSPVGGTLGVLMQFACHPVDHGGTGEISGGWPGLLSTRIETGHAPVCLFLNGAYGNVIPNDFQHGKRLSMEETASRLFDDYQRAVAEMEGYEKAPKLATDSRTLELSFRQVTDAEYHGTVRGAQRFRSDELYEGEIDRLRGKFQRHGCQRVELQIFGLGNWYFAGVPAEYFVEYQLRLKTGQFPKLVYVVGGANGMIGYVPTREAFERGGYETTLGPPSWMAPETGDRIAETVSEMLDGFPAA